MIVPRIPEHERYLEPFFGGGSVYFDAISADYCFANDINSDLMSFYSHVKSQHEGFFLELYKWIEQWERFSLSDREAMYYEVRDRHNSNSSSEVIRAIDFFLLRELAYGGMFRVNSNGEFNVPFGKSYGRKTDTLRNKVDHLRSELVIEKMQKINLHSFDFQQFINSEGGGGKRSSCLSILLTIVFSVSTGTMILILSINNGWRIASSPIPDNSCLLQKPHPSLKSCIFIVINCMWSFMTFVISSISKVAFPGIRDTLSLQIMTRISEKQLIVPALYLITRSSTRLSTTDLIRLLQELVKPTGEDLEILAGRNDSKFSQKVRNLVSHETLLKRDFVKHVASKGTTEFESTERGRKFVNNHIDQIETLLSFDLDESAPSYADIFNERPVQVIDDRVISEGELKKRTVEYRTRSTELRNAAYEHYKKNGRILCDACEFEFAMAYPDFGDGYIQIHHLKPVSFLTGERLNLDQAIQNVCPLCANCHQMVHIDSPPIPIDQLKAKMRVSYTYN